MHKHMREFSFNICFPLHKCIRSLACTLNYSVDCVTEVAFIDCICGSYRGTSRCILVTLDLTHFYDLGWLLSFICSFLNIFIFSCFLTRFRGCRRGARGKRKVNAATSMQFVLSMTTGFGFDFCEFFFFFLWKWFSDKVVIEILRKQTNRWTRAHVLEEARDSSRRWRKAPYVRMFNQGWPRPFRQMGP